MIASYVDPVSGTTYPIDRPRWCSDDRRPLLLTGGKGIGVDDIDRKQRSIWRYAASLPVAISSPVTLGEGCTPAVQRNWHGLRPHFKLEWFNPTGSFKDRGTSVMLSYLRQFGVQSVVADSSGNGGSSIAGYGAAAGMSVNIVAPASTSSAKLAQVRAYGAHVQCVEGPRNQSEAAAIGQSDERFYASHNWNPWFLEGTKSLAYEIWEDFGFRSPDNIVMPVGGGSALLGCAFGFRELLKAGQIDRLPRLFAAQPLNCSPIDASFSAGVDCAVEREVRTTLAEGTAIRQPLRLREIVAALAESGGATVTATEDEIVSAYCELASQGLFAEPTSACAAAALVHLERRGKIRAEEDTVVILTGTGLKAADKVAALIGNRAA